MASQLQTPRRAGQKEEEAPSPSQIVDFALFRKKYSEAAAEWRQECLFVRRAAVPLSAALGGLHLCFRRERGGESEDLFRELATTNVPKIYTNYMNSRTLAQFLQVFRARLASPAALADLLANYPVAVFLLDLYARQHALLYLAAAPADLDLFGNEGDVLNDLAADLRGSALELLARSLKLSVGVRVGRSDSQKFVRKSSMQEVDENYGCEDYCLLMEVKLAGREMVFSVLEERSESASKMRKSRLELLQRKSRTRETEHSRATLDSRSVHKDCFCEKCGTADGDCKCGKEGTPRHNLNKSVSGGFVSYGGGGLGLGIGFINVNKIMGRDVCSCQALRRPCHCRK